MIEHYRRKYAAPCVRLIDGFQQAVGEPTERRMSPQLMFLWARTATRRVSAIRYALSQGHILSECGVLWVNCIWTKEQRGH